MRESLWICLSEDVLEREFSDDSRIWVIVDGDHPGEYLLFPINVTTTALWAFMKREDAEHLMYLLKTLAPPYKDMNLVVADDLLKEVRAGANENNGKLCVWSPVNSLEFFRRYKELLGHYYGV